LNVLLDMKLEGSKHRINSTFELMIMHCSNRRNLVYCFIKVLA